MLWNSHFVMFAASLGKSPEDVGGLFKSNGMRNIAFGEFVADTWRVVASNAGGRDPASFSPMDPAPTEAYRRLTFERAHLEFDRLCWGRLDEGGREIVTKAMGHDWVREKIKER